MDFIHNAVNYVIFGGLHTHLIVLTVCVVVAIPLIQYSFHFLFRQIDKKDDDLYDTLHHAFREIPALLSILSGVYITKEFLTIPPRPMALLGHLFTPY